MPQLLPHLAQPACTAADAAVPTSSAHTQPESEQKVARHDPVQSAPKGKGAGRAAMLLLQDMTTRVGELCVSQSLRVCVSPSMRV